MRDAGVELARNSLSSGGGLRPRASGAVRCLEEGWRDPGPVGLVVTGHFLWLQPLSRPQTKAREGFPFSRELQLRTDTLSQFLKVSSFPGRRGGPASTPSNAQCTSGGHSPAARQAWRPTEFLGCRGNAGEVGGCCSQLLHGSKHRSPAVPLRSGKQSTAEGCCGRHPSRARLADSSSESPGGLYRPQTGLSPRASRLSPVAASACSEQEPGQDGGRG